MIVAAWLSTVASAQATPVFRSITLVDGRSFDAEILSTEATGMAMRTQQGTMLVPFELLVDIRPIQSAVVDRTPWRVLVVVPEEQEELVERVLGRIDGLSPGPVGGSDDLSPIRVSELATCHSDIACLATVLRDEPWRWILTAEPTAEGGLVFSSVVSTARETLPEVVRVGSTEPQALWTALHDALGLDTPAAVPPELLAEGRGETRQPPPTGSKPSRPLPSSGRLTALSFVPVPGMPSLACGDQRGMLTAVAVVVPATAVWTLTAAAATRSVEEAAGLSVAGYYGLTVLANQWTGERSRRQLSTAVVPTRGGGVAVVSGRF